MMCDNCKLKGHTDDCIESDCSGHLERELRATQHENAILIDVLRKIRYLPGNRSDEYYSLTLRAFKQIELA